MQANPSDHPHSPSPARRGSSLKARGRAAAAQLWNRLRLPEPRHPKHDLYVVGYPKVGNTWFQLMLRRAMTLYYGLSEDAMWHLFAHEGPVPAGVPSVIISHQMPRYNSEGIGRW